MIKKKPQQGIALIWVIIAGTLLITGVGIAASKRTAFKIKEPQLSPTPLPSLPPLSSPTPEQVSKNEEDLVQQEPLLKILPPKEQTELENAIRETQEVLKNIQPFNPSEIINTSNMLKGLDQVNKQTSQQIQKNIEKQREKFQPIDPEKIEEHFRKHPPAVPRPSSEDKELKELEETFGVELE